LLDKFPQIASADAIRVGMEQFNLKQENLNAVVSSGSIAVDVPDVGMLSSGLWAGEAGQI
jgi:hypothetical protein